MHIIGTQIFTNNENSTIIERTIALHKAKFVTYNKKDGIIFNFRYLESYKNFREIYHKINTYEIQLQFLECTLNGITYSNIIKLHGTIVPDNVNSGYANVQINWQSISDRNLVASIFKKESRLNFCTGDWSEESFRIVSCRCCILDSFKLAIPSTTLK